MSHRCLTDLGKDADYEAFYFKALQYGHYLWLNGHAGRALLAITRALYSNVDERKPILKEWALPYAALAWIIQHHSSDDFPGNPRISFQHQATRLKGERQALRRARAWGVWAIICKVRPSLPADIDQVFKEPSIEDIYQLLLKYGHPTEADNWRALLQTDIT